MIQIQIVDSAKYIQQTVIVGMWFYFVWGMIVQLKKRRSIVEINRKIMLYLLPLLLFAVSFGNEDCNSIVYSVDGKTFGLPTGNVYRMNI